jgi:hypothetical protein
MVLLATLTTELHMSLIVSANLVYGEFEGRHTFKVDDDVVTLRVGAEWVSIKSLKEEFLIDVWFQCANHDVKHAIEALGLV